MAAPAVDPAIPLVYARAIPFGEAGGRPLRLDAVYLHDDGAASRPAAVWVHGGLIDASTLHPYDRC